MGGQDENDFLMMEKLMPNVSARSKDPLLQVACQRRMSMSASETVGKRSGIVVQKNVRKDSMGFEDLDEFWGDEDSGEEEPAPELHQMPKSPIEVERKGTIEDEDDDMDAFETSNNDYGLEAPGYDHAEDPINNSANESTYSVGATPQKSALEAFDTYQPMSMEKKHFGDSSPISEMVETPSEKMATPSSTKSKKNRRNSRARESLSSIKSVYTPVSAHPRYVSTPMTGDSTFSAATATLDESFLPDSDDEEVLSDESASASDYDEEDATLDMSFDKDLAAQILQDETSTTSMNDTDDPNVRRRSGRRRFKPLAWYKGEHLVFERKDDGVGLVLPTVTGVKRDGVKTPQIEAKRRKGSHQSKRLLRDELPQEYTYLDAKSVQVWDQHAKSSKHIDFISSSHDVQLRPLPAQDHEPISFASQTFKVDGMGSTPGWVSGTVQIPPFGLKQAESTGKCTQVFHVLSAQKGAVEVAIANPLNTKTFDEKTAQRFLLSPGDEFYIPPMNQYSLRNHSKTKACSLRFMIIRPTTSA